MSSLYLNPQICFRSVKQPEGSLLRSARRLVLAVHPALEAFLLWADSAHQLLGAVPALLKSLQEFGLPGCLFGSSAGH